MSGDDAEKATEAIPILNRYVGKAMELAEAILSADIRCDIDEDHFGFMALCFLSEQVGYLRAITKLVQRGLGKPAGLVARSMVEGMALLRWSGANPDRPKRWRLYAWISDFRTMRRDEKAGKAIDAQKKAGIEGTLKVHADQFLSSKARKNKDAGKRLPEDPYVRSWYEPNSLADIFEQIKGAKPLYERIYRTESERTHWSVGSLGRNIRRTERGVTYAGDSSPEDDATALAVGFQSLVETLLDIDEHLQLGRGGEICSLRDRYVADLKAPA